MKKRALVSATVGSALLVTLGLAGCSGTSQQSAAADPTATMAAASSPASTTATAESTATAKTPEVPVGNCDQNDQNYNVFCATLGEIQVTAHLSASDPKNGLAPEGKAWLRLSGVARFIGPYYYTRGSRGERVDNRYHGPTNVVSATVTGASGAKFEGVLDPKDTKDNQTYGANGANIDMVGLVPANVDDFSVSMVVNNAGKADNASSPGFTAPAKSNMDFTVPAFQVSFKPTK